MLTKSVNLRATAATHTGCVRHGVGHQTSFSGRGSRNAAEDLRPNILQLNTEGLTADKISVIEQLAYKNKAFIIVLRETRCTTAVELVIPNFSLAGSILSRNHGLATLVHERLEWSLVDQSPEQSGTERLEWSLVDQSPEQSGTEWLCADVAGYKIVNVYKPPHDSLRRPSRRFHTPACMMATSIASTPTGVTTQHPQTARAWTPGQHPTILDCCTTQRKQPVSSLAVGTSAPTQTWPSRASARTADCQTDVS